VNFEFPLQRRVEVLCGPRVERRRVLVDGTPFWGTALHAGSAETSALRLRLDDGRTVEADLLPHLPPFEASKIIGVHISYASRSLETRQRPRPGPTPTYFTKPPSALNGHGGVVLRPEDCRYLNYEGELAVIIGKTCRNVVPDEAWDYIAGFCPALDMGVQDFRDTDQGSMLRVKGADTLLPIGPGIVRGVDVFAQTLRTFVNGQLVQEAHIGEEMIWGPHYIIADLARHITLQAGDVLLLGTPAHSRSVSPGDVVECEISQIGRLRATVQAMPTPRASALGVGHPPTDSDEVRRVALGCDERVRADLVRNLLSARERQRTNE
jgi:5-oxopent-3-ene-1,2,5-tricarboxylate decarboxylase/2-hydroxyhepta-2,4-diene-1,7-dioate isomerase